VWFTNNPKLIIHNGTQDGVTDGQTAEKTALAAYRDSVLKVAGGKSILFGLNRDKIKHSIEDADPLVRVTNIEAKFPNRIEIKVQERYAMYYVTNNNSTAILDYELRILSVDPTLVGYYGDLINLTPEENPQFEFVDMDNFIFSVGKNLKNFVTDEFKDEIDDLIFMAELFFGDSHRESELRALIDFIEFDRPLQSMVIKLKKDPLMQLDFINIEIRGYKTRFAEKLTAVWSFVQTTDYRSGWAMVEETYDGKLHSAWIPQGD
jgi:hypothetical protein